MTYVNGKRGDLTKSALVSGQGQARYAGTVKVVLWSEHGMYYVRGTHYRGDNKGMIQFWSTYTTLREARKAFYAPVKPK